MSLLENLRRELLELEKGLEEKDVRRRNPLGRTRNSVRLPGIFCWQAAGKQNSTRKLSRPLTHSWSLSRCLRN